MIRMLQIISCQVLSQHYVIHIGETLICRIAANRASAFMLYALCWGWFISMCQHGFCFFNLRVARLIQGLDDPYHHLFLSFLQLSQLLVYAVLGKCLNPRRFPAPDYVYGKLA